MNILLGEGLKVTAEFDGFRIVTDQPKQAGGSGAGPTPFDMFLVSLGTCAGFFVLRFLKTRNIDPSKVSISLEPEWKSDEHMLASVQIMIKTAPDFPEEYKGAVIKAAESCLVAKHLGKPPKVDVRVS